MDSSPATVTPLAGHVSPETAYVVDDYPYGFVLRCKIRYWIEFKPKHGFRFVSQTSNPKRPGLIWNKPKAGTYSLFGAVMLRDESNGYISYTSQGQYCDAAELRAWFDRFGAFLCEKGRADVYKWVTAKETYEAKKAEGLTMQQAGIIATAVKNGLLVDADNNITNPATGATVKMGGDTNDGN